MGERVRGSKGQALRKRRLINEPLCRMCKSNGKVRSSTVPDHILPLALGGDDVDSNIRCLCAECHRQVTAEQFGYSAKIKVDIGADGWPKAPHR